MITNVNGNVMIPKSESNGHVTVEIYESAAIMDSYLATPTPEEEPERLSVYIGTKFQEAQEIITSLDGLTLADKLQSVLETVVIVVLADNFKVLQRTKFEDSDWSIV
jgi:hypothetical protein